MSKDGLKETLINFIVPLIAIGISIALFLVIILPGIQKNPEKELQITDAQSLNTKLTEKKEKLGKIESFENVITDYESLVSKVLLSEPKVPELLTQVDTIAKESGLAVTKLTYSFTDVTEKEKSAEVPLVNVSLGATGNYDQLVTFFENLEKAARLVYVDSFRFSEEKEDNKTQLAIQVSLASPYLTVDSKAVTDEPITIDIADQAFISFVDELKKMRYYELRVDTSVSENAQEQTPEDVAPVPTLEPPVESAPQAPAPIPTNLP